MLIDATVVMTYAAFVGFASLGAVVRSVLGVYKVYTAYPEFVLEKRRIGFEILASVLFGTFAVFLLRELGLFSFGLNVAALVAGLLGADLINLITKRLGLTKSLQVVVSRQQMGLADLNEREIKALEYAKSNGKVTNRTYQKINETTRDVARRELNQLVKTGRLLRSGDYKKTHYVFSTMNKTPGNGARQIRAVYEPSAEQAHKMQHKARIGEPLVLKCELEPKRRGLRNRRLDN